MGELMKQIDYTSLEIDGIDMQDFPDFCDAYISAGSYTDGTELSDEDLEQLNNDRELVYSLVEKAIY